MREPDRRHSLRSDRPFFHISPVGGPSQGEVRPGLVAEWATPEGRLAISKALVALVQFHAARVDPELAKQLRITVLDEDGRRSRRQNRENGL